MLIRGLSAFVLCAGFFYTQFLLGATLDDRNSVWTDTVNAAKKEGRVTVYASAAFDTTLREFKKKYPEIKVVFDNPPACGGQRIMAEQRAGKYLVDVYACGVDTAYSTLYTGRALDPIKPALILPEVLDESKWWQGKHRYADPDESYIFVFEGSAQVGISYNTELVDPHQEFRSYWDFLKSKWRGKMVAQDPEGRGGIGQRLRFLYHHPSLGPEFVRRLFGETDMTLSRDRRQIVDWLARGKFAIAFHTQGVDDAKKQGLPVDEFSPQVFREGALVDPRIGAVGLVNRAPHGNAAKLLINWLLSREGQIAFQRQATNPNSLREDIPKDDVAPGYRRVKGVKYMWTTRPDWIDMAPIYRLIREARSK